MQGQGSTSPLQLCPELSTTHCIFCYWSCAHIFIPSQESCILLGTLWIQGSGPFYPVLHPSRESVDPRTGPFYQVPPGLWEARHTLSSESWFPSPFSSPLSLTCHRHHLFPAFIFHESCGFSLCLLFYSWLSCCPALLFLQGRLSLKLGKTTDSFFISLIHRASPFPWDCEYNLASLDVSERKQTCRENRRLIFEQYHPPHYRSPWLHPPSGSAKARFLFILVLNPLAWTRLWMFWPSVWLKPSGQFFRSVLPFGWGDKLISNFLRFVCALRQWMLQTVSDSLTEVLPSTLPSCLSFLSFVLINKGLLSNLSKFVFSLEAIYL